jgi:DNA-binding response OmpR family regulator
MSRLLKREIVSLAEVPWNDSICFPERRDPMVLVVDDERIITDTLSMILSKSGYNVLTAYDGMKALELARAIPPALLITDVMMPGMTGIELAIMLLSVVTDCKVLLFSGQAATVDLLAAARDIGHDFAILTKPVHPTDMLRRVSECFDHQEVTASS